MGLIVMVGIGGAQFRDAHLRDTVALIERLPLDAGDLVYLSPFVSDGSTRYDMDMQAAAIAKSPIALSVAGDKANMK